MKGIVIYYSGSGSTQKVAGAIYMGMKKELEICDIASVKNIDPVDVGKYDVVAIGGPIWYYRETANLREFAYKLPRMDGKYVIPFCVHGASPSGFFYSLVPTLLKKGLTVIGWNDWYGSVFHVLHMPKPYLTDGHPDEVDLREAEQFGRDMAIRAKRIAAGDKSLIPEIPKGANSDPLWKPGGMAGARPQRREGEGPGGPPGGGPPMPMQPPVRRVIVEKCRYPECTACIDNCLVNAFDFSTKPPTVRQNCLQCNICDRLCVYEAIETKGGMGALPTTKRIDMTKCKYPECTICIDHCAMNAIDFSVNPPVFRNTCEKDDLCYVICPEGAIEMSNLENTHGRMGMSAEHGFNKNLEEAEKTGKFRRLVPLDKVGWDNPIWKMKQRPIFNIKDLYDDNLDTIKKKNK